jgi:NitT/TauT family transport system substrate-binding protein
MAGLKDRIGRTLKAGLVAAMAFGIALAGSPAEAAPKTSFKVAWTIYAGWMPWGYAVEQGIVKKWADKYGITIDMIQMNDYIESINQYTAGSLDGVLATNMDALTIPAVGGVDTTSIINGDYSNGNDGILMKEGKSIADLKGAKVNLVELSVSHYLLARALESAKLSERDVTLVNTSDADFVAAYGTADVKTLVAWNPALAELKKRKDANLVFDSSQIPGEIMDIAVVNTQTLKENPALGKALVGAWFEVLGIMSKNDAAGIAAKTSMAKASGTDLAGYEAQLATTKLFYTPADVLAFSKGPEFVSIMKRVRDFCFGKGLLGNGAKSADVVGIQFPDGSVLGDKANVKLRFDTSYVEMAAEGKL